MKPKFLTLIKALLLIVAVQVLCNSCSSDNDEPEVLVNYYLALDSSEIIGLSEEELNGSLRPTQEQSAYKTYIFMRRALHEAFPQAAPKGNDARVIAVCDSCYRTSIFYYAQGQEIICTVRLMRATQSGDHVVSTQQLKYYRFKWFSL